MQYVIYFNDSKGSGTLCRHKRIEVHGDSDPLAAARQFIAENDGKNGYRNLKLTGLAKVWGEKFIAIPIA